jgi:hypothetical protein
MYVIYCYISAIVMSGFLVCLFLSLVLFVAVMIVSCSGSGFFNGGGRLLLTGVLFPAMV